MIVLCLYFMFIWWIVSIIYVEPLLPFYDEVYLMMDDHVFEFGLQVFY